MSTRRNYITDAQKPADSTDDQIALAEEIIDAYVGYQERFIEHESDGEATSLIDQAIYDTSSRSDLAKIDDYFAGCIVEILSGDAAGEVRTIASSSRADKSITYSGEALSGFAVGDIFRIYQLAKFPRKKDVMSRTNDSGAVRYYKSIPRLVRDATIAQVEYIIEQGDDFFVGDSSDVTSENIGNYGYSRGSNAGSQSAIIKMIAPRARHILKPLKNSLGRLEA